MQAGLQPSELFTCQLLFFLLASNKLLAYDFSWATLSAV